VRLGRNKNTKSSAWRSVLGWLGKKEKMARPTGGGKAVDHPRGDESK
jgi:hypothetical protein